MDNKILAVGDIIRDVATGTRERVIAIEGESVFLCKMDTDKLVVESFSLPGMIGLICDEEVEIEEEEPFVFDEETLSENVRAKFEVKRLAVNEAEIVYGPTFTGIASKRAKPELKAIMEECGIKKTTFWRSLRNYLQSGRQYYSLVDPKAFGLNKGKQYKYEKKPGRKGDILQSEVIVDDTIAGYFDEAIEWAKSGRKKPLTDAYVRMIRMHFNQHVNKGGRDDVLPLPDSLCPTLRQFLYYAGKKVSKEEWDKIRTSPQEVRNNARLLPSDAFYGVHGPGDMAEIDECETDYYLVSLRDRNQSVGRAIVYFMVDVYTDLIIAVAVGFENNSLAGVGNLFINLGEDKREFCSRYGINLDDETLKLWPSGFVPRRVRTDRGAEYKSAEFTRICTELGIEKENVPGATGSYKGLVEHEFRELNDNLAPVMEDYGLIEKRHDSNHQKEATINIDEFTAMVINFVLTHNQEVITGYPRTQDMIDNDIKPIPVFLWEYGTRLYGMPRPIPNVEQYMFTLLKPVKASYSRKGIYWKGLWYYPENDSVLLSQMYRAGNKRVSFEVRMDPRCVGAVYYIRDHRLMKVPLNPRRTGNADFRQVTMADWEEYWKEIKKTKAQGRMFDMMLSGTLSEVNEMILAGAKKDTYSNAKDVRQARREEKSRALAAGRMEDRLPNGEDKAGLPDTGTLPGTDAMPGGSSLPDTPEAAGSSTEPGTERYADIKDAFRKHRNS